MDQIIGYWTKRELVIGPSNSKIYNLVTQQFKILQLNQILSIHPVNIDMSIIFRKI